MNEQEPTPRCKKSVSDIAIDITSKFYPVNSLKGAELRLEICKAIVAEREAIKDYMWGRLKDRIKLLIDGEERE